MKNEKLSVGDAIAEVRRLQTAWDEAYLIFKEATLPLEMAGREILRSANEEEAFDRAFPGGLNHEDPIGLFDWSCDLCDETGEGASSTPPMGWTEVTIKNRKVVVCPECAEGKAQ